MSSNTTPTPAVQANLWRKKPVVIQATQWFKNGDHPNDYAEDQQGLENGELRTFTGAERKANGWEGGVVRYYRHPDVPSESLCEQCGKPHHIHGWIDTLEQGHRVCPDDWIITGVKGEHYPCKPDIFATTYEDAALAAPPAQPAPVVQPLTEHELERLAVKHEAFGFGEIPPNGLTIHGFEPDGLHAFVTELLAHYGIGTQPQPEDSPPG